MPKTPKKKPVPKPQPKRLRAPRGGMTFRGKFYRGGCFIPGDAARYLQGKGRSLPTPAKKQKPNRPEPARVDDAALLLIALSELPTSAQAATSLHRLMNGRATQRDQTVLKVRELQAVERLRDRATTDREWMKWNNAYTTLANGVTT